MPRCARARPPSTTPAASAANRPCGELTATGRPAYRRPVQPVREPVQACDPHGIGGSASGSGDGGSPVRSYSASMSIRRCVALVAGERAWPRTPRRAPRPRPGVCMPGTDGRRPGRRCAGGSGCAVSTLQASAAADAGHLVRRDRGQQGPRHPLRAGLERRDRASWAGSTTTPRSSASARACTALEEAAGDRRGVRGHAVLRATRATSGASTCSTDYERTGVPPPLPDGRDPHVPEGHTLHRLARLHTPPLRRAAGRGQQPAGPVRHERRARRRAGARVAPRRTASTCSTTTAPDLVVHVHLGLYGKFGDAALPRRRAARAGPDAHGRRDPLRRPARAHRLRR